MASFCACEAATYRVEGRFFGPHSQAGQKTDVARLFMVPGGTLMRSRVISPEVIASRCWAMASMCQP